MSPKRKHKPQRTCIGCREVLDKGDLMRVVRTPEGVVMDQSGKMPGRGAYVHPRKSCWENALQGSIARALRVELSSGDRQRLEEAVSSLPR
jgi:predicted RNA-binding protein YlxR (DUF448 family)